MHRAPQTIIQFAAWRAREQHDREFYMRAFRNDRQVYFERDAPVRPRPGAIFPAFTPRKPRGPMAVRPMRINWLTLWTGLGVVTFVGTLGVVVLKATGH